MSGTSILIVRRRGSRPRREAQRDADHAQLRGLHDGGGPGRRWLGSPVSSSDAPSHGASEPKPEDESNGFRTVFLGRPGAGKGTQARSWAMASVTLGRSPHLDRRHAAPARGHNSAPRQAGQGYMDKGASSGRPDLAMVEERLRKPDAMGPGFLTAFPYGSPSSGSGPRPRRARQGALERHLLPGCPQTCSSRRLTAAGRAPNAGDLEHRVPADACAGNLRHVRWRLTQRRTIVRKR
jgi:hypothetical protein